jgi:hypothetical protein
LAGLALGQGGQGIGLERGVIGGFGHGPVFGLGRGRGAFELVAGRGPDSPSGLPAVGLGGGALREVLRDPGAVAQGHGGRSEKIVGPGAQSRWASPSGPGEDRRGLGGLDLEGEQSLEQAGLARELVVRVRGGEGPGAGQGIAPVRTQKAVPDPAQPAAGTAGHGLEAHGLLALHPDAVPAVDEGHELAALDRELGVRVAMDQDLKVAPRLLHPALAGGQQRAAVEVERHHRARGVAHVDAGLEGFAEGLGRSCVVPALELELAQDGGAFHFH